ncbi:ABC transporter substrate-binding protein [Gottfriedia luciferensis]|uniref:ABC transporter substrate-binding protein n=1 Tax=Gottfriedia luciferensis TaxID=178774 RepID=UPI000B4329D2|nr:ABC transporter substrate-binding protein [Gottfriedia luciferensis]
MKKLLVFLTAICLMLAGCSQNKNATSNKGKKLRKVTVVLDWTPNTNHTGLFVAKEKGYFKEQGLDVDIISPGETGADQLIASGKADFGVSYQESITQARVQNVPIVSIAAIIQHNTSGFASPVSKGIKTPKDFVGKTYGGWGSPVEKAIINSLMTKENANSNKVKIVNMGEADFFTAVKRDIDFAWIYQGWTGIEAQLRGEKLNMIYLTDYSKKLDYYTPVLATNEKMISKNPKVVKAFLAAASKGYSFAIKNPKEAASILLKDNPDLNKKLVEKSQEWLASKYQDDANRWGEQKLSVWKNYADFLTENKLLEGKFDPEKAFTNEFLPK